MTPPRITATVRRRDCAGLWQRTLLVVEGETVDITTDVRWLQGGTAFVDLRRPAQRPDFTGVRGADDLSTEQRAWLATQEGFAGHLAAVDDIFDWHRFMGLQPQDSDPDTAQMSWNGEVLVEVGVHSDYVEHWIRPDGAAPDCWAVDVGSAGGERGLLVRVGDRFGWARTGPDEVSLGTVTDGVWLITDSSLPFREGADLTVTLTRTTLTTGDLTTAGDSITCRWTVQDSEGNVKP